MNFMCFILTLGFKKIYLIISGIKFRITNSKGVIKLGTKNWIISINFKFYDKNLNINNR